MSWGVARLIKIIAITEQQGADGIEPSAEEVKNVYAQVNMQSQTRGFDANRQNYKNQVEFLIRVDSDIDINGKIMLEHNNRRFSKQTVDTVDIGRKQDKYRYTLLSNPNGRYWRIVATSEDIS